MREEFKSLRELYNRVKPALSSKLSEMKRVGFTLVNEEDIWNYLVENNWKSRTNLELHELISDILYVDNYAVNDYVMDIIKKNKKEETINVEELI